MPKQISRAFKNLQSLVLQAYGTNELAVLKNVLTDPSTVQIVCNEELQNMGIEKQKSVSHLAHVQIFDCHTAAFGR